MDVTTDVSVMVVGLVMDDAKVVQVPSFNGEDAGGERCGGAGPVRGVLLRVVQAAAQPRLRRAGRCGGPSQARVDADLRTACHARRVADERVEVPRGDHPRGGLERRDGGLITLEGFRGIVFVGGFNYADVLESARGWAATILYDKELKVQFEAFYARPDAFSLALLGICNGCQWLPADGSEGAVEGHRGGHA